MSERTGVAIAVVSSCLGGTAAAVTRYLVSGADPITLAVLRWGIGFLCVLPAALILGADEWTSCAADVAMLTRTGARAWIKFTGATYTSGTMTMTIVSRLAMWGNAETVTVTQTSAGVYVITYPTTVTDELGATKTLSFVDVLAVKVASSPPRAWYGSVAANVVTLHMTDLTGSANACNGQTITVFLA